MHITNSRVLDLLLFFLLVMMLTTGEITTFSSNLSSVESSSIEITTIISISTNSTDNEGTDITVDTTTNSTTSNDMTTLQSTVTNESTMMTTSITFISTETMIITPEICSPDISNGINVINRTSTMFIALINYNCSSINSSELIVFVNETSVNNCYINEDISENINNSTINVRCHSIQNNAGRNWTFTLGGTNFRNKILVNETFVITLEPLSLNISTNISIEIDDNLRSASVFIPNCLNISDPEYLIFRCNSSDLSNNILEENCTYKCFHLEPGSISNASLVRLSIPIVDKIGDIFQEESLYTIYITDLDKVTNFSFNENDTNNKTALISFDRPGGYYDQICVHCLAQDQHCLNDNIVLMNMIGNCSNCTSISISPITRGVSYQCQAITLKEDFTNITSDQFLFRTSLQPMINEKSEQNSSSYLSYFTFNVTPQSDFDYIQSFCTININQTFPCSDLTVVHQRCSTILKYDGILGCTYQCYFVTQKLNYLEKYSDYSTMSLLPPKPIVNILEKGSRSISINWILNELGYVKSFELFRNETPIRTVGKEISSYNYIGLLPNQVYQLHVKLIANFDIVSDSIFVETLEEVPRIPSNNDIKNKIIPLTTDRESKSEQYVIEIDLSLFSNEYGIVHYYRIYVRQDQNKNTSKLDSVGTYSAANRNQSIDYLALVISRSSSINDFMKNNEKRRIIIGNQTLCEENFIPLPPCNGKLKADTNYKIVVSGCANPGCTSVLSQPFRTQKNPTEESGSIIWTVLFPILALLILGLVGIWKRKEVKSFYGKTIKKFRKTGDHSIHFKSNGSISVAPIIKEMRPKLLIEYINMSDEDEKAIYAEYKELQNVSPQFDQSSSKPDYASLDRYPNISARGPWDRTAVRLRGEHRRYDYINANEIKSSDNKKHYIACQGPLKETCQDFWDMILQYNIPTIIMLTKTEERNPRNPSAPISKCYHYFPINVGQFLTFGEILVKVTNVEYYHNSDLEIRYITIKEGAAEHRLIHYYFTGWPDYNVVQPRKLLDLIETIDKHRQYAYNIYQRTTRVPSAPTVVHCSAGVGRTGTYIAVDTIIRLLDCPNEELPNIKLDIMGIVYQLRKQRGKMVQTKEQYMLINRCVEEHLKETRRLDIILKRSNVYENGNTHSSTSSEHDYINLQKCTSPEHDYINLQKSTSSEHNYINLQKANDVTPSRSSIIDQSPRYINLSDTRSLAHRSHTSVHAPDGYRNRLNTIVLKSIYHPLNENYYLKTADDNNNEYIPPPLPPRRIRSTHSYINSQQWDA